MATKKNTKAKAAPVEEVDEDDIELEDEEDDDELELEDLDADVEDNKPAKKSKAQAVEFGVADLAAHLTEATGSNITPRELRALIRKMAREDSPRVQREIVAGNKSRYNWPDGLKDPEVKAIVKAVTGGELEADKKAKLEELKANKAKKAAAAPKAKKGKGKAKAKPAPVEDDDDDIEEIEIDDDED